MPQNRRKTVKMTEAGIEKLPDNKPVVYRILDRENDNIYTGIAGRGNVQERIKDHLPRGQDAIPGGAKVRIEQKKAIDEAKRTEQNVITRSKPKYNKQGK